MKKKLIPEIQQSLLRWYQKEKRDLPWRKTKDPYSIWISEIMLQQTQVDTVIPYYNRWMKKFPTIQKLAKANEDVVLKHWEGLGYYSRARNIQRAAKTVEKDFGGRFPKTREDLLSLPGIGLYTVGAILSIAYNKSVPLVDGNVIRVLTRIFNIHDDVLKEDTKKKIWSIAGELVPEKKAGDFNQSLMELGATLCTPGTPLCLICPVNSLCKGFKESTPSLLPVKKKKMEIEKFLGWMFLIEKDGHFLLQKRKKGTVMGGLWEFPSFREGIYDHPKLALKAKTKILCPKAELKGTVPAAFTKYRGLFQLTHCPMSKSKSIKPVLEEAEETAWAKPKDFKKYTFSAPTRKAVEKLSLSDSRNKI